MASTALSATSALMSSSSSEPRGTTIVEPGFRRMPAGILFTSISVSASTPIFCAIAAGAARSVTVYVVHDDNEPE
jgi:hypothetical protein